MRRRARSSATARADSRRIDGSALHASSTIRGGSTIRPADVPSSRNAPGTERRQAPFPDVGDDSDDPGRRERPLAPQPSRRSVGSRRRPTDPGDDFGVHVDIVVRGRAYRSNSLLLR